MFAYLSMLRNYVVAVVGKLELVVKLPHHPALHLQHLHGALTDETQPTSTPRVRRRAVGS